MPFAAVLDANVLYPLPLRDTLLRIAETELYDPYWSERVLDEVVRNLMLDGRATEGQAARLAAAMDAAFVGAAVTDDSIARLEPAMTNDPKDRHVLAAAVASDAQAIVTFNLKDFPPEACEPFAIEAIHPDDFLLDLYELSRSVVAEVVDRQAAVLRRPPMTKDGLLDRLAVTVPRFAAALR
ncbi:PIN domain-containing protein [Solirubrobacter ginsenosidimutans]|uniref:PIN domain-containing protein n=1 Tax=Solirubrobacter ginsenosidimutans TaxID=490573 RepID=A0A9X3RYR1_9ACTN|nr:PIN domain-containing protein [Solirubrobacter ginsenosidimutans]MDA0159404.1 PIN domain-containing protein [Solirubrobacter ginsenosidimutans]